MLFFLQVFDPLNLSSLISPLFTLVVLLHLKILLRFFHLYELHQLEHHYIHQTPYCHLKHFCFLANSLYPK